MAQPPADRLRAHDSAGDAQGRRRGLWRADRRPKSSAPAAAASSSLRCTRRSIDSSATAWCRRRSVNRRPSAAAARSDFFKSRRQGMRAVKETQRALDGALERCPSTQGRTCMSRGMSALALWLLSHLAHRNEPLAGDLLEQFRVRRSVLWLWSQLLIGDRSGFVPSAAHARRAQSHTDRSDRR